MKAKLKRKKPSKAFKKVRFGSFVQVFLKRKQAKARAKPIQKPKNPKAPVQLPVVQGNLLSVQDLIRPQGKLKECIESFFLDQRSPHTKRAYAKDLKRFIKFLLLQKEAQKSTVLDRALLVAFKEHLLSEKLQPSSIDRHLVALKGLFQWLVHEELLEKNPLETVRFLNAKRLSKTGGFTDEEVTQVLSQPNLHRRTGAMHYAILMLLFYCGLRRSEICALRTSQLSVEQGYRVLRLVGKGNKERILPLVRPVWNAIQFYFLITGKRPGQDQYLFSPIKNNRTQNYKKPLDASMIYYLVRKYAKQAGIQGRVSPHSCRATAISNARDHQVPDRAIQEFAGWSSTQMIVHYDKRKTAVIDSAAHAIHYGKVEQEEKLKRLEDRLELAVWGKIPELDQL